MSQPIQEEQPYEDAHEAFDVQDLPPVLDAPRTAGPALAGAAGLLLLGLGGAIGAALAIGAPPLDGLAAKAMKLGLTPGVALVGGTVTLAVAVATHGLAGLLRRTIDTLELASDPVPLLERVEDGIHDLGARAHDSEQRAVHGLRTAIQPLTERLGNLENAVTTARLSMEEEDDPSRDAVWRLAASMDQIRAQLDQRLSEQLSTYEDHLAAGLERASQQHLEALESALRASQAQIESEVAADPLDRLDPVDERKTLEQPEPENPPTLSVEEAAAPLPNAPEPPTRAEEHKVAVKRPASVPPSAAAGRSAERQPAPAPSGPDDSLGVFDQLDEHGKPKAPMPSPKDVAPRSTPTEPMPDIYGGADDIADMDGVGGARPRFKPKPSK